MNEKQHETQQDQAVTETAPSDTVGQDVHEPVQPVVHAVTKRRKWPWVVLVVVVLIAVAAAAYFFLKPPAKQEAKKAPAFATAQSAVDTVTAQINKDPLVVTSLNGLGGTTQDNYLVWDLPFYRIAGNKFLNAPTEGVGKGYAGNSIDAARQFTTLSSFFENHEYKQIEKDTDFKGYLSYDQAVIFDDYRIYESDNMVCAVSHMDATDTLLKNHVASVGCAEKASYKKAADALRPFYAAYVRGKADVSEELVFGNAVEGKGADGYKNAVLYQEDPVQVAPEGEPGFFRGLYYKAPGDKQWTYFTSARSELACSAYTTDILKMAFHGSSCYDEATRKNSVVS